MESIYYFNKVEKLPSKGNHGDLVFFNGEGYVWLNKWECISETKTDTVWEPITPEDPFKIKPKICLQCGAPFHGYRCEYCDTEYFGNKIRDGTFF